MNDDLPGPYLGRGSCEEAPLPGEATYDESQRKLRLGLEDDVLDRSEAHVPPADGEPEELHSLVSHPVAQPSMPT